MSILKSIWHKSRGVEKKFKHKAVLFIPTESYDAPTITVIQGLQELGWTIYTIHKSNINSWFANSIIDDPNSVKFDFVLSNLHWGNRWDYYNKFNLHGRLKVLIDGCDNRQCKNWREKYDKYRQRYESAPSGATLKRELQPYRWMEPLYGYEPDLVFTSQKPFGDKTYYLPFGIHREFLQFAEKKPTSSRRIDFLNIPGPGIARERLTRFLKTANLPGCVLNKKITGDFVFAKKEYSFWDRNVHSWHRWTMSREYFRVLNDSKVLIVPNVYDYAHWDSRRPWEGLASGCLCLFERPNVDMSEYPVTELCKEMIFDSYGELIGKCKWLYKHQELLERFRLEAYQGAMKYFVPKAIARLFLWRISAR